MKPNAKARKWAKKYRLNAYRSKDIGLEVIKGVSFDMIIDVCDSVIADLIEREPEAEALMMQNYIEWFNAQSDVENKEKYPAKKQPKVKPQEHPLKNIVLLVHKHVAKKLGIPTIRVKNIDAPQGYVGFFDGNDTYIGFNFDYPEGSFVLYSIILHETRHAFEAYLSQKYLTNNCIPSGNVDKLLLLYTTFHTYISAVSSLRDVQIKYGFDELIENFKKAYFKVDYFASLHELDAYTYEIDQLSKIQKRVLNFKLIDSYEFLLSRKYTLLSGLNYHKEGLNHKEIKSSVKVMKKLLYCSMAYEWFGHEHASLVREVVKTGVDVEAAYSYYTQKLDEYYDDLVLLAHTMRDYGFEASFEKNGILDFEKLFIHDEEGNSNLNEDVWDFLNIWAREENPEIDYDYLEDLASGEESSNEELVEEK